ncbi:MAG: hypothetical protein EOO40_12070 [Deltaproteobacteria bacterium]|nr:MAG: hypothetical protein EOO40_12070 [Deltaproteobacteria bacterium]
MKRKKFSEAQIINILRAARRPGYLIRAIGYTVGKLRRTLAPLLRGETNIRNCDADGTAVGSIGEVGGVEIIGEKMRTALHEPMDLVAAFSVGVNPLVLPTYPGRRVSVTRAARHGALNHANKMRRERSCMRIPLDLLVGW